MGAMRTKLQEIRHAAGGLLALSIALFAPRTALAEADTKTQAAQHPATSTKDEAAQTTTAPATSWYGYETLIPDIAAAIIFNAGMSMFRFCMDWRWDGTTPTKSSCNNSDSNRALAASGVVYFVGAPAIHATHGHWDKAGYSLGIRFLPVATAAALAEADADSLASFALIGGGLAAMAVDSAVLAKEPAEPSLRVSVAPSYEPKSRAAAIVMVGAF